MTIKAKHNRHRRIIAMLQAGRLPSEIAERENLTVQTVRWVARRHGFKIKLTRSLVKNKL